MSLITRRLWAAMRFAVRVTPPAVVVGVTACLAIAAPAHAFVYWSNSDDSSGLAGSGTTISRADADGTGAVEGFITGAGSPAGIAVDGRYIYWANQATNSIGRANLDGSGADPAFVPGTGQAAGVAVDGTHIYWANSLGGTIGRANLDGTGADQNFITGASNPDGVAVDGQHVYWVNAFSQWIARANLDGSGVDQAFIEALGGPYGIAVDAQHIFWSDTVNGAIARANLDGSQADLHFIADAGDPFGITVDTQHIYWTNALEGEVARANIDGTGVVQNFITGAMEPLGVAVDTSAHSGPTVSAERLLGVSQTTGTVAANINPDGASTHYHVEWGPTTDYGANGPDLPSGAPLTGQRDQTVGAQLSGLAPATTYHWRIVASSAVGTSAGADQSVTTAPAGGARAAPPTAVLSITRPVQAGARTLLSAVGSSGNGSPIVSYKWDWTGIGNYSAGCGSNPVAMPVYTHPGTYDVGLQVTDANGQSSTTAGTVTVSQVPTGASPAAGPVAGYSCASLVGNVLCTHHIEWDLIVADALDNGCFEQVIPRPNTQCAVCAHDATSIPTASVPPPVANWFHKTNAKTWEATGRVLVNGTIVAPQMQLLGVQGRHFKQAQTTVLINEVDDTIYAGDADLFVAPPSTGNLPDTVLALTHHHAIFAKLPLSAPTPATLAGSTGAGSTADRAGAPGAALVAHAAGAPGDSNPCEDPQVKALPALGQFDPTAEGLGSKVDGFPLSGPVTVHVINGVAISCVEIELPSFTPCGSGQFELSATLLADQGGLSIQSLRAHLPCAIVAGVIFQNVFFAYDAPDHHWAAGGDVEAIPGLGMDGTVEFDHGDFVHAGAQLDTEPLLFGALQLRDVGIDVYPTYTSGHLAVNVFPNIPGIDVSPLDIMGQYELRWKDGYFRVSGQADTFGIPFANAEVLVYDNGRIHADGSLNADVFGVFRANAEVQADFWNADPLRFNVFGEGQISIFDLISVGGEVLMSDNGAAACAAIEGDFLGYHYHLHIGGALNWNPFGFHPMFAGCDVGVERDAPPMARDTAAGLQTPAGFAVPVSRGTRYEIIGVDGSTAPPAVALSGPHGERFAVPADHPVLNGPYVVLHDPVTNSAFVIVRAPARGRWTVTPLPDSAPITGVHFATSLPAPAVAARVAGAGRHRRLSYRIARIPGQVVRFIERGPRSLATIGTVRGGGRGTIRFTPTLGPAGMRQIVAIVEQDGRPRTEMVVARFRPPGPPRLARPAALRATRRGTSLVVHWRPVRGARAYTLTIATSDRRHATTVVRTASFTFLDVPASTTARITATALDPHGRGPTASLAVRATAKHRVSRPAVNLADTQTCRPGDVATGGGGIAHDDHRGAVAISTPGQCRLIAHGRPP